MEMTAPWHQRRHNQSRERSKAAPKPVAYPRPVTRWGSPREIHGATGFGCPMHISSIYLCRILIRKRMELKRLRAFVAVAEQGTVSRAAIQLHISQPALSRQIGDLERELEFKLFDRVGRRLYLTGEGEQLLGRCRNLLGHANSLGEE